MPRRSRRITWPPKAISSLWNRIPRKRYDGEPVILTLERMHPNDNTLRAHEVVACCDCGLTHLYDYSVLRAPNGEWCLVNRAYRVPKLDLRKKGM